MELLSFRIFIDIILDCTAEFFCQELQILCGFPGRCIQELTAQGVISVLDSLLVPSRGPWTTIQDWVTSDCIESALDHKVEREGLKLWCCNLFCDVVGEARKEHLGPLPVSFTVKWHFPLLSYFPAKLWPVLLLTFILVPPKADLATKADVVLSPISVVLQWSKELGLFLLWRMSSRHLLAILVTEQGRGEKQYLSALFTNWDLETEFLSSAHNHAEPGKNEPMIS